MIPLRLRLAMGAAGTVSPLVLAVVVRFGHYSVSLWWGALFGAGAATSAMALSDAIREWRERREAQRATLGAILPFHHVARQATIPPRRGGAA